MMLKAWSAGVLATLWAGAAFAANTPEQKCQGGKSQAAGKYALCRARAEKKQVLTGDGLIYSTAIARCDTKYALTWERLEQLATNASTTCPSTADDLAIQAEVTVCTNKIARLVSGNGRFVDNADGTVTDRQTGLTWEKKINLSGGVDNGNPEAADNSYPWGGTCTISGAYCQPTPSAAAACAAGVDGASQGCAECGVGEGTCDTSGLPTVWEWLASVNAASFAGHDDWRLPNLSELESIADRADSIPPAVNLAFHGASCGVCSVITSPACACTNTEGHWTATSYAPDPNSAWLVSFDAGVVLSHERGVKLHVRAVRGGP